MLTVTIAVVSVSGRQGEEACTWSVSVSFSTESCLPANTAHKRVTGRVMLTVSLPSITNWNRWWYQPTVTRKQARGCCGGDAGASRLRSSAVVPVLWRSNFLFLLLRLFKNNASQSRRRETAVVGMRALGRPFLVHNGRKALLWFLWDLRGLIMLRKKYSERARQIRTQYVSSVLKDK